MFGDLREGEDTEADRYGLQVGKVDGVRFRWMVGEVASGVIGPAWSVSWFTSWVGNEVAFVMEAACIPIVVWWAVEPWGRVMEDSVKSGPGR